jgi:membrane protein YdbS with pleckstrin-like domain
VGEEQQLDPRVVPMQRIGASIFSACLAAGSLIAVIGAWTGSGRSLMTLVGWGLLWISGNAALAWHGQRWPAIEYRYIFYRIDDRGIEIRRGVYWRRVITVPRSRVQHTDVSQGPLERRFGLGTLVLYTAGTDHAKVTLAGLDHAVALRLREQLMPERGPDAV